MKVVNTNNKPSTSHLLTSFSTITILYVSFHVLHYWCWCWNTLCWAFKWSSMKSSACLSPKLFTNLLVWRQRPLKVTWLCQLRHLIHHIMGVAISKNLLSNVGGTIFFSWKLNPRFQCTCYKKTSKTFSWINKVLKALQLHFYHMSLFCVNDGRHVAIMNLQRMHICIVCYSKVMNISLFNESNAEKGSSPISKLMAL